MGYTEIMRKNLLTNNEIYHIFSRSIADFMIFNDEVEFNRMEQLLRYYQIQNELRFSDFLETKIVLKNGFDSSFDIISKDKEGSVQIIAYCFMPTHIHLILKQLTEKGISKYMNNVLNGFSRYFNIKHRRKGPLWESRFKSVLVETDEQLLHLTRYIHLNPVTAELVDRPEDWIFSSYRDYLSKDDGVTSICQFEDILELNPEEYHKFVNDRISYQREIAKVKSLLIE